jgi:hypothetical protein
VHDDDPAQPTDNRQTSPAATDGVLRLTYDQIGRRLGMTADAARQLARRKDWPRTRPNHIGEPVVVSVPASELPDKQPSVHRRTTVGELSDDRRSTDGEPTGTTIKPPTDNRRSDFHSQALTALEDAVAALREAKDSEIATLHGVIDGLRASIGRAEDRAGRAEQERDALRDRLNGMHDRLADAHVAIQAAEEAKARADRAEQGRDEERGRADRAETATAAERARADALRERIEALQVQLTARQEVVDAAEATRRAEDERRARGRLRRAWDGWRGR